MPDDKSPGYWLTQIKLAQENLPPKITEYADKVTFIVRVAGDTNAKTKHCLGSD